MGRVYLARSPGGVLTAVKVIREDIAERPDSLARFRREVDLLGSVRSPYTAHFVDAGLDAPPFWLATEYVPGPTLLAASRDRPLPPEVCTGVLAALAEALAAVHRVGVVHRDVKPHNVILASGGPRLIDFGIAWAADLTPLTDTGHTPGTPGYAAPEAMSGGRAGPPADVFALGATLAAAATGRPPFGAGDWAAIGYRVVHGEIDVDGVPAPLADLIRACVAKDPAERPPPDEVVRRCAVDRPLALLPAYVRVVAKTPPPDVPEPDTSRAAPPPRDATPQDAVPQDAPPPRSPNDYLPPPVPQQPRHRSRALLATLALLAVVLGSAAFLVPRLLDDDGTQGPGQGQGAQPDGQQVEETELPDVVIPTRPPLAQDPADFLSDLTWLSDDYTCDSMPDDLLGGLSTTVSHQAGEPDVSIQWRITHDGGVPESPYHLLVAVRPPGTPTFAMSAPDDLSVEPGAERELTYPDDFPGAAPLLSAPGDWTVLFLHPGTDGITTVGCNGFTAP